MKPTHAVFVFVLSTGISALGFAQSTAKKPAPEVVHPIAVNASDASRDSGSSEYWKGAPEKSRFEIGALSGLGVIDSRAGFALLFTGATKVLDHGFIPDITNSVSLETEMGPLFVSGATPFQYSFHMRWDFKRDSQWTFYALGGIGGDIAGDGAGGSRFLIFPRVGVGTMVDIGNIFNLRAELSHELIAVGVTLPLF